MGMERKCTSPRYVGYMNEAVHQIIGQVCRYVQIIEHDELGLPFKVIDRNLGKTRKAKVVSLQW